MDSSSIAQSVPLSSLTCLLLILQAGIKCFQVSDAYTASHPQAQATFCPVLVLMCPWMVFSVMYTGMDILPARQLSCPTDDIRLLSESASTTWAVLAMVAGLLDHTTWASLCFASHLHQWALTAHETVTGSALSLDCTTFDWYNPLHTGNTSEVRQSPHYHNLVIVKPILAGFLFLFLSFIGICLTSS